MRNDLDRPADCRYNWLKVLTYDWWMKNGLPPYKLPMSLQSRWAKKQKTKKKNKKKNLQFYKVSSLDYLVLYYSGLKIFSWTNSSCRASGLKLLALKLYSSLVLSLVLKTNLSIKSWNLVHELKRGLLLLFCCGIVNSNRHLPELKF